MKNSATKSSSSCSACRLSLGTEKSGEERLSGGQTMAMIPCLRLSPSSGQSCCCSSSTALIHSSSRAAPFPAPSSVRIGVRAMGVKPGRIGSRRRQGGGSPRRETELPADEPRKEPFLQVFSRRYREEGHQPLDDAETLLAKASNPFGLVIRIAEEANEYLRNNKDESLIRKPILKVISDRINEAYGESIRDSYLNEKEDYSEFEAE